MQLADNDIMAAILSKLDSRLDFFTREDDNRSPYNKAYSILSDEIELNGTPTLERAYHLLLVRGIKPKGEEVDDRGTGIHIESAHNQQKRSQILRGSRASFSIGGEVIGKVVEPKKENKMNKGMAALMLGSMLAQHGLGGWDRTVRQEKSAPPKEKMKLTDEETQLLSQLSGKDKKRYVKELKTKYNF